MCDHPANPVIMIRFVSSLGPNTRTDNSYPCDRNRPRWPMRETRPLLNHHSPPAGSCDGGAVDRVPVDPSQPSPKVGRLGSRQLRHRRRSERDSRLQYLPDALRGTAVCSTHLTCCPPPPGWTISSGACWRGPPACTSPGRRRGGGLSVCWMCRCGGCVASPSSTGWPGCQSESGGWDCGPK